MENKIEATIVYWDYIGVMEKKMETTTIGCQIAKGGPTALFSQQGDTPA